jgi:hypothetical protein
MPPQYLLREARPENGVLVFLSLQEDALKGLKDGYAELTRQRIEEWRAARDARRKASGAHPLTIAGVCQSDQSVRP